jgi:hypothetical protein
VKKNEIRMMKPVRVHQMGYWDNGHMTNYQKWTKAKVVALNYSFQNQLKFCSEVLPLWRYEVKYFQNHPVLYIFYVFLNENNSKQQDFNTFRRLSEGATTFVLWEILPKKEGTYPKRETDTERLQKNTDRLQKSVIDYKVY